MNERWMRDKVEVVGTRGAGDDAASVDLIVPSRCKRLFVHLTDHHLPPFLSMPLLHRPDVPPSFCNGSQPSRRPGLGAQRIVRESPDQPRSRDVLPPRAHHSFDRKPLHRSFFGGPPNVSGVRRLPPRRRLFRSSNRFPFLLLLLRRSVGPPPCRRV